MTKYLKHFLFQTGMGLLTILICAPAWADWDQWRQAVKNRDEGSAYREVLQMAQQGDSKAKYIVGYYLNYGIGVVRNPAKGEEWIKQITDDDKASGMNKLAYNWAVNSQYLDAALILVREALVIKPDNPYYLDTLAWVFYQQEHYEEALNPSCRSVRALPQDAEVRIHLAQIYFQLGLYEEAKNEGLTAIDLLAKSNPSDYFFDFNQWRAELQEMIGQADEKMQSQALPVNPAIKPCLNLIS